MPGIRVQHLAPDDESTHKDFTIVVDEAAFGVDRDTLRTALRAEGIDTRCYFSPPVHRHTTYRSGSDDYLPRTDWLAARVISLPLWRDLDAGTVESVAEVVARVHEHAEEIGELGRAACVPS